MLKYLHDVLFGHFYKLRKPQDGDIIPADETIFECRCGEQWFPGFTLHTITRRDHFAHFQVAAA